jgi:hypothetical protein
MAKSVRRKVILHYHVFKNAGTSVDEMLKASLGDRWKQWDKDDSGAKISAAEMEQFILDQPDVLAVSSHQVVPPLPNRHLEVYPIVLIRHPIDRAYSAYLFEWKKQKGSQEPVGTFESYVLERLQLFRKSAIDDFQTLHFANRGYESRRPSATLFDESLLSNAKQFVRSLPVVGLVDRFPNFLEGLKNAWGTTFPELSFEAFHANALQEKDRGLSEKIEILRKETEPEVFERLVLRNQLDLRLYEYACARCEVLTA